MAVELPSYIECRDAVRAGVATSLQTFIYDNEPSVDDEEWRDQVAKVIAMERERCAELVEEQKGLFRTQYMARTLLAAIRNGVQP